MKLFFLSFVLFFAMFYLELRSFSVYDKFYTVDKSIVLIGSVLVDNRGLFSRLRNVFVELGSSGILGRLDWKQFCRLIMPI